MLRKVGNAKHIKSQLTDIWVCVWALMSDMKVLCEVGRAKKAMLIYYLG
ncbi:hypothetical protein [uncultured Methanobrevibacter sp.]|nr:hypothetical protein [uncultured Methanobrevibacter sp.]